MNEDLITGNFIDSVNRKILQRNIKFLQVTLILFSVYMVLAIAQWYSILAKSISLKQTATIIVYYRITPVVHLTTLILSVYLWYFYLKGHRLILLSFEKDNPDLFNEGYYFVSKANTLNIIGYSLIILVTFCQVIIK
jgi:hypothetical protein